ncbi:hypothetical protein A3K92_01250 [Thermococcus gorgonarius]|uniref:Uncharacterized protein n=2 Tax=Thermococcus gorgonarius TaxID=71997 RepID=A0A2Z2M545_THEGO|nr:hypothetical protein A3K92_01250 [Thermococcus gorgonarius]
MIRLGYPDRIVEIRGDRVYLFKRKLYSADVSDVIRARYDPTFPIPAVFLEVAEDVARVLERFRSPPKSYPPVAQNSPTY